MDKKPLWRKITQGWVRIPLRKSRVKPNETVRATIDELGTFFNEFELVEEGIGEYKDYKPKAEPKIEQTESAFHVEPSETAGWYNIVDPTGKVMNEKKLRAAEAEELRKELDGL